VSPEPRNARFQAAAATTTWTDTICRQHHSAFATLLHPVGWDWNGDVNVGYVHIRHRVTKLGGKPTSFYCRNVWTKVEDERHSSSSVAVHWTKR
jgi:hypothetical protein